MAASFIVSPPALAQVAAVDTSGRSNGLYEIEPKRSVLRKRLRFQVIDRDRGLPQNTVTDIAQDQVGFIWLGTDDGLARYDGSRFRVFRSDPNDQTSLSSSSVSAVLSASDGRLYVGTTGGGLNRYDARSGSFERFEVSDEPTTLNDGTVFALAEGVDGRIWVATNGGGLSALNPNSGDFISFSEDSGLNPVVTALFADPDGSIWVGTAGGLYRFQPKEELAERFLRERGELGSVITAVIKDSEGDLWIGTDENGLAHYSLKTQKLRMHAAAEEATTLADNSARTVFEDSERRLWVGTSSALHLFDRKTESFERHLVDPEDNHSLPGQPRRVYQDRAGAIWVATLAGGAAIVDPLALEFNFYPNEYTTSMHVSGETLLVGSAFGVCRWRGRAELRGECFPTGVSLSVLTDGSGTTWVGTETEGLFRLERNSKNRWTVFEYDEADPGSIAQGLIVALHEDRRRQLWVGGLGVGLQLFDRRSNRFTSINEVSSDQVYSVRNDPKSDDVVWVSTADAGLFRLDTRSRKTEQFLPRPDDADNRSDNSVPAFLFDGQETVWLATYGGGLKRLDLKSKEFTSYTRESGMPSDTVYSLAKDSAGNLWMGTVSGIARFDPKSEEVHAFSSVDGLQSDEFTLGAGGSTTDGLVYFGGRRGFNLFKPSSIEIETYKPPVVITTINVLGEPLKRGALKGASDLTLAYDESFVDLEFAALAYSGSEKTRFEYKVDGLNERWFSIESSTLALPGLKDGSYTLLLRATNRHGVLSETTELKIKVAPPLWRRWWAYLTYAAIVLGMLFGIYRYQQIRIIRLEKLARLATVEKELDVTADVQSWFLPRVPRYTTADCDLVGFYRAADKSSGDWWWYEDTAGGKLWVIIADVTGHGAGPAMMTAAVAMGLRVQGELDIAGREDLVGRLERVNAEVLKRAQGRAHMTMTAIEFDHRTGVVQVFGVGGLPAVLLQGNGKHTVINPRGNPIGSGERLEPAVKSLTLAPGDRLMLLTDGIVETLLPSGKAFGFRRFAKLLHESRSLSLDQAVQQMAYAVDVARAGQPQDDDFTFCLLERRTG